MVFDDLSNRIIGCAVEVHRELGPGLLESAYEQCLKTGWLINLNVTRLKDGMSGRHLGWLPTFRAATNCGSELRRR